MLPCSLVLAYKVLEEENIKKSPGPPDWELMQQVSPLLIEKQEIAKSPLETLRIDATDDDISYVRGLYD